jgi:hypothetical protein
MAQYERSYNAQPARLSRGEETSFWALGFILLASVLMVTLGTFHILVGLTAVLDDTFYVVRDEYELKIDVTTWGWIHVIGGAVVALAGFFLLTGNLAARILAVFLAILSATWSFYSIPYYPLWSCVMLAVSVAVIWAVAFHGLEMKEPE